MELLLAKFKVLLNSNYGHTCITLACLSGCQVCFSRMILAESSHDAIVTMMSSSVLELYSMLLLQADQFHCILIMTDRQTTDRLNRLLNPASRMHARGNY